MANGVGRRTKAAGVKIFALAFPSSYGYTRITKFVYTASTTAHTATVLRAIGQTTASSVAAAGVAAFSLAADPGPAGNLLAPGDLVAIRETDGVTRVYKVDTYTGGTLTITSARTGDPATLVHGVGVGSKVWDFGVEADTDPFTGEAHETYALAASATTTREAATGLIGSHLPDQPVLFSADNVTAAGTLDSMTWAVGTLGSVVLSGSDPGLVVQAA